MGSQPSTITFSIFKYQHPLIIPSYLRYLFKPQNHLKTPQKMSAPNQGRQSPSPEESSGKQQGAPSSCQGINKDTNNKEESKNALEGLQSNPAGPLDAHLKETMKKTETPDVK